MPLLLKYLVVRAYNVNVKMCSSKVLYIGNPILRHYAYTILIKIYKERTIMRNEKGCLFIVVGAPDVCRLCEHNEEIMVW